MLCANCLRDHASHRHPEQPRYHDTLPPEPCRSCRDAVTVHEGTALCRPCALYLLDDSEG